MCAVKTRASSCDHRDILLFQGCLIRGTHISQPFFNKPMTFLGKQEFSLVSEVKDRDISFFSRGIKIFVLARPCALQAIPWHRFLEHCAGAVTDTQIKNKPCGLWLVFQHSWKLLCHLMLWGEQSEMVPASTRAAKPPGSFC